jgi:hypothetical protein
MTGGGAASGDVTGGGAASGGVTAGGGGQRGRDRWQRGQWGRDRWWAGQRGRDRWRAGQWGRDRWPYRHAHGEALAAQRLHNQVLVLREHLLYWRKLELKAEFESASSLCSFKC